MDQWDHLKLFLAVARSGTLAAAATSLGISASTLHRQLAAFEEELGAELFDKGPRGYQLTAVGEALLPRAEEVEESVFSAARAVIGHDQQASGEVRLTLPLALLPAIAHHLARFSRRCPGVKLILQADDSPLDLGRETDLALRATTRPVDTAVGQKLCDIAWARYASVGAWAEDLPWIHYKGMDRAPAVIWRKKTYPASEPLMQVEGVVGMLSVLETSGAQGLLPYFVGERASGLRRLGEPVARNELWLLIHAELRRSARVRAVIDDLVPRIKGDRHLFEGNA